MKYPPVNQCIYCDGAHTADELGDEHIVPLGLNGDMILPKSSCFKCAAITGAKVEQIVLRKMLIDIRTHMKMKTRRPKERPDRLLIYKHDGKGKIGSSENIPIHEHPVTVAFPGLSLPTLLLNKPPRDSLTIEGVYFYDNPDFHERLNKLGPKSGYLQQFPLPEFTRMLAKIAHAYATAELGHGNYEPILLDLILGKTDNFGHFVGASPLPLGSTRQLHNLHISRTRGYVDVRIQLLANFGGTPPTYLVVTGR